MNELEYKNFYDKVGKINGWDFSNLKFTSEGVKWDFYEEVKKRCKSTDILLDIGTGGGENVLRIASSLLFLVGIDISSGMRLKLILKNQMCQTFDFLKCLLMIYNFLLVFLM